MIAHLKYQKTIFSRLSIDINSSGAASPSGLRIMLMDYSRQKYSITFSYQQCFLFRGKAPRFMAILQEVIFQRPPDSFRSLPPRTALVLFRISSRVAERLSRPISTGDSARVFLLVCVLSGGLGCRWRMAARFSFLMVYLLGSNYLPSQGRLHLRFVSTHFASFSSRRASLRSAYLAGIRCSLIFLPNLSEDAWGARPREEFSVWMFSL